MENRIVLHGEYENGKVIINDPNPPQIRTKVDIVLHDEQPNAEKKIRRFKGHHSFNGFFDDKNIREMIYNTND